MSKCKAVMDGDKITHIQVKTKQKDVAGDHTKATSEQSTSKKHDDQKKT